MAKIASDVEPRASTAQLRRSRGELRRLAEEFGLSNLRLAKDGTLVVHVDTDPSYRPVLRFVSEATRILGAEPHVVTDDAPIADRLTTAPLCAKAGTTSPRWLTRSTTCTAWSRSAVPVTTLTKRPA